MADAQAAGQFWPRGDGSGADRLPQQTDNPKDAAEAPLESQIDALINGLDNETPADDVPPPGAADVAAQSQPPIETSGSDDDPLADQIQEMLDAARDQQQQTLTDAADVAGTEEEVAVPTDAKPSEEPSGEPSEEPSGEPSGELSGEPSGGGGIEQLDAVLAEEADDILAGEFESVHEVLGTEPPPAEAKPAEAVAEQTAVESPPIENEQAEDTDAPEIAGDFVDPDDVQGETELAVPPIASQAGGETGGETDLDVPSGGDFSATAEDVADELDDDNEVEGSFAAVDDVIDAPPAEPAVQGDVPPAAAAACEIAPPVEPAVAGDQPKVNVVVGIAHKTCCVISKPVALLSDEWRNIIGYAGVVTLFNFSVLMLYKLCTSLLG